MHREKFPERIPFRLTRMLINAMEVSGIEGNYRSTCESVMTVLREVCVWAQHGGIQEAGAAVEAARDAGLSKPG